MALFERGAPDSGRAALWQRWSMPNARYGVANWLIVAATIVVLAAAALSGYMASPLILVAVVVALGGAVLLRWPAIGLVALPVLAILVPFDLRASTEVRVNVAVIAIPIFIVVWVLAMMRQRHFHFTRSPIDLPAAAFLGSALLSLILGNVYWDIFVPRPPNVLFVQIGQWALYAFSFFAMWLAANLLVDGRWLRWVTFSYLIVGGFAALIFVPGATQSLAGRVVVLGSAYSPYWYWMTAMALSQLLFNRTMSFAGKAGIGVVLAALIYLTLTGTGLTWVSGYLPMFVVILLLLILRYPRRAVPLLLVAAVILVLNRAQVIQSLGLDTEIEYSGGGRLSHWQIVWEFARRHPIFGLGLAAYRHYSWARPDLVSYYLFPGASVSTHNNFYDIFAFMGAVGLSLFIWFAARFGRLAWRTSQRVRQRWDFDTAFAYGVAAGFIGMLASGLLGDWFLPFVYNIGFVGFRSSVIGWVLMGGLIALWARTVRSDAAPPA